MIARFVLESLLPRTAGVDANAPPPRAAPAPHLAMQGGAPRSSARSPNGFWQNSLDCQRATSPVRQESYEAIEDCTEAASKSQIHFSRFPQVFSRPCGFLGVRQLAAALPFAQLAACLGLNGASRASRKPRREQAPALQGAFASSPDARLCSAGILPVSGVQRLERRFRNSGSL